MTEYRHQRVRKSTVAIDIFGVDSPLLDGERYDVAHGTVFASAMGKDSINLEFRSDGNEFGTHWAYSSHTARLTRPRSPEDTFAEVDGRVQRVAADSQSGNRRVLEGAGSLSETEERAFAEALWKAGSHFAETYPERLAAAQLLLESTKHLGDIHAAAQQVTDAMRKKAQAEERLSAIRDKVAALSPPAMTMS